MPTRAKPGLFVMEGRWSSKVRDVRSVEPVLRALADAGAAVHVKHHLNHPDDLLGQLQRWGQAQHGKYRIGYVALHGSPGTVHIGRFKVDLFSLAAHVERDRLGGKWLHFGSCSVLALEENERKLLRQLFGVKALTGFTEDVDWFESLAFELLMFEAMTTYSRPYDAERYLRKHYGELAERLGFVMVR